MSEPNKARTIPLHIADQAVAACEGEVQKLREENARLKAENERLIQAGDEMADRLHYHWNPAAQDKDKARYWEKAKNGHENRLLKSNRENVEKMKELKAEVERLRKAGDWMCGLLRFDFVTKEWNAAKEGKQS